MSEKLLPAKKNSCFIVSNATILSIVAGIHAYGGEKFFVNIPEAESRTKLGDFLFKINTEAYNYRYSSYRPTPAPRFRDSKKVYSIAQTIKSIRCFVYQCAEGDIPEKYWNIFDALKRFEAHLREMWMYDNPAWYKEYEAAEWDIPETNPPNPLEICRLCGYQTRNQATMLRHIEMHLNDGDFDIPPPLDDDLPDVIERLYTEWTHSGNPQSRAFLAGFDYGRRAYDQEAYDEDSVQDLFDGLYEERHVTGMDDADLQTEYPDEPNAVKQFWRGVKKGIVFRRRKANPPAEFPRTTPQMLRYSIEAELDATNLYEQFADSTQDETVRKVMLDIAKEEKTHAGEFQALLVKCDPEMGAELKAGAAEVASMNPPATISRIGLSFSAWVKKFAPTVEVKNFKDGKEIRSINRGVEGGKWTEVEKAGLNELFRYANFQDINSVLVGNSIWIPNKVVEQLINNLEDAKEVVK